MAEMESAAELQGKIAEYRGQLADVDTLLATDPGNEEFSKLRSDLEAVIGLTQQLLDGQLQAERSTAAPAGASAAAVLPPGAAPGAALAVPPDAEAAAAAFLAHATAAEAEASAPGPGGAVAVGDRAEAKLSDVWYACDVVSRARTAAPGRGVVAELEVLLVVDGSRHRVPAGAVRPLVVAPEDVVPLEDAIEGAVFRVKYAADEQFYEATVQAVDPGRQAVTVTYTKYGETDTVPLEYLRRARAADEDAAPRKRKGNYERVIVGGRPMYLKIGPDGLFEVPENLTILDTDTETERQKKKKTLKKIRYQNKLRGEEQQRQEKKSSWQAFKKKDSKRKASGATGKRRKQESIFATSESGRVGVTNSGKGMTNFEQRKKYKLNGAGST